MEPNNFRSQVGPLKFAEYRRGTITSAKKDAQTISQAGKKMQLGSEERRFFIQTQQTNYCIMASVVSRKYVNMNPCPAGLQTRWEGIVLWGDLKITPPQ